VFFYNKFKYIVKYICIIKNYYKHIFHTL
jgi:hypothetical protein